MFIPLIPSLSIWLNGSVTLSNVNLGLRNWDLDHKTGVLVLTYVGENSREEFVHKTPGYFFVFVCIDRGGLQMVDHLLCFLVLVCTRNDPLGVFRHCCVSTPCIGSYCVSFSCWTEPSCPPLTGHFSSHVCRTCGPSLLLVGYIHSVSSNTPALLSTVSTVRLSPVRSTRVSWCTSSDPE